MPTTTMAVSSTLAAVTPTSMTSASMAPAIATSAAVAFAAMAFAMLTFVVLAAPCLGLFTRHDGDGCIIFALGQYIKVSWALGYEI